MLRNDHTSQASPTGQPLVSSQQRTTALSRRETDRLLYALQAPTAWIDSDALHCPDAEKKLMHAPEPIRRANVSWYSPYMETVERRSEGKLKVHDPVLLTREQEGVIFHQYNYTRLRAGQLRQKHAHRPLTSRQARELIRWHRREVELREQIAEINLPLVLAMASRVKYTDAEYGDLVAEGNMALLRSIDNFDVDRGFKFSTYACRAILTAFSRWGMKQSRYRKRLGGRLDPLMDHTDWPRARRDQDAIDDAAQVRHMVLQNTIDLSDVEQNVLHHRFGLGKESPGQPDGGPMTLAQVGKTIGLTKERVRQIQNRALTKLRDAVWVN
jgi:RNA polymerase sigma factor (sigma-70 family)